MGYTMKKLEFYGLTPEKLLLICGNQPPSGDLSSMQEAAHQDAFRLVRALDTMLPYGTWKAFLQICKLEAEKLG
jgi:hypothetical protein